MSGGAGAHAQPPGGERPVDADALGAVADLVAVVDRLRSPGGSPWYAAQTHASLLRYVLEEAHEVAEAVGAGERTGEWDDLREELGDLLLQVVLHARLAAEHDGAPFGLRQVAEGVAAKLRRRHPHVFPGAGAGAAGAAAGRAPRTAAEEEAAWEPRKAAEKSARASALDGVPAALPALQRAQQVLERAQAAGLVPAPEPAADLRTPAQVGEHLLRVAAAARAAGVDAEGALRSALQAQEAALREREGARARARR
ncbi:MazG nucleotide pyrophosphohydrolase domain-containing protein [Quadrisphaera sp. DSM 44207]|uniref:MazG nucleotide pyrophosphohydrolase domain-containing protein n=1 Tax=Quadrisphaera sp. DSM 44207 TaxID=1881057 RepID=UPI000882F53B|nr:MazG nucleotide pyrophosphohydrolase domain-containing protein [Quadrisphaera sp. DSM 44207]SDQ68568.1 XTP/dITP diphosphohydrolase [Quadrisphaera sp. DSM 44207]